jgi:hypothetical protein
MRIISGAIGGMKIGRGNRSTRRKPTPVPLCPPQNPTWQTRSRTPDRSGGKPGTNRLSYGVAFFSPISSPLTTRRVTVEVFDPASTRVCYRRVESAIKECNQLSGVVCKPYKYRQHGTIWNLVRRLILPYILYKKYLLFKNCKTMIMA